MSDLPPEELVKALREQAQSESAAHKMIADAKTARQTDRDDYPELAHVGYDWIKPEQTVSWKAAALIERLEAENARAWRERNAAYAKVKAWEATVFVEGLPLRAVQVDEWGPGEGETVTIPQVTPQKLTDLLDEIAALRKASKYLAQGDRP